MNNKIEYPHASQEGTKMDILVVRAIEFGFRHDGLCFPQSELIRTRDTLA